MDSTTTPHAQAKLHLKRHWAAQTRHTTAQPRFTTTQNSPRTPHRQTKLHLKLQWRLQGRLHLVRDNCDTCNCCWRCLSCWRFGVTDIVAVVVIPLVFDSRLSAGLLLLPLRPRCELGWNWWHGSPMHLQHAWTSHRYRIYLDSSLERVGQRVPLEVLCRFRLCLRCWLVVKSQRPSSIG